MKSKLGVMVSSICTKQMLSAFSTGNYHGDAVENTMRHLLSYLKYTGHVLFNKSITEDVSSAENAEPESFEEATYSVTEVLDLYQKLPNNVAWEKLMRMMVWVSDKDCRGFVSTYCSKDPLKFEMLGMDQNRSKYKYDAPMVGVRLPFPLACLHSHPPLHLQKCYHSFIVG